MMDVNIYEVTVYNFWDDFYYSFSVVAKNDVEAYEKALMEIDSDTEEIYNMV